MSLGREQPFSHICDMDRTSPMLSPIYLVCSMVCSHLSIEMRWHLGEALGQLAFSCKVEMGKDMGRRSPK